MIFPVHDGFFIRLGQASNEPSVDMRDHGSNVCQELIYHNDVPSAGHKQNIALLAVTGIASKSAKPM